MSNEGRIVLITGGAYGIGRALVKRFAGAGDRIVIADRNVERGKHLEQTTPGAVFRCTDVRNEGEVQSLVDFAVERFGGLDVLCSNAGIESYRRADQYSMADWSAIMDTNLRAAFLLARYSYHHLRQRAGCIVFTSSVQAFASERSISVYASSKAGLLGLMRGMALDFAPERVRVNAVCPGATSTGMLEEALSSQADPAATLQSLNSKIPLGRIGTPEDIAHAVFFLASSEASYITGTQIIVDGGILAGLAL